MLKYLSQDKQGYNGNVFDVTMNAESGRAMAVFQLHDDLKDAMNQTKIVVVASVVDKDGQEVYAGMNYFFGHNKNGKMAFYWSDNEVSQTGAKINFAIYVVGYLGFSGNTTLDQFYNMTVYNSWCQEVSLDNGISRGCIYTITKDFAKDEVSNVNFTFNWDEVDCDDCNPNDDIIIEGDLEDPAIDSNDPCDLVPEALTLASVSNNSNSRTIEVLGDNVIKFVNGTGSNALYVFNGEEYIVGAKSEFLLRSKLEVGTYAWQIKNLMSPQTPVVKEGTLYIESELDCNLN